MNYLSTVFGPSTDQRIKQLDLEEEQRKLDEQKALRESGVNYLSGYMDPSDVGATPAIQQKNLLAADTSRNMNTSADGTRPVTVGGSIFGYDQVPSNLLNAAAFPQQAAARAQAQAFPAPPSKDDIVSLGDGGGYNVKTGQTIKPVAKPDSAGTELAKANADFLAGRITKEERDAIAKKNTYIAPEPQEPLVSINDPDSPTGVRMVPRSQANGKPGPQPNAQAPTQIANNLRDEFNQLTAGSKVVAQQMSNATAASKSGTAAGDMSLIYSLMKTLDPGSTVREGEYAQGEQLTGVAGRFGQMYNKAVSGQKLTPQMRADILARIHDVYVTHKTTVGNIYNRYSKLAETNHLKPSDVVSDVFAGVDESGIPPSVGQVVDGYKFKGGDPANPASWAQVK